MYVILFYILFILTFLSNTPVISNPIGTVAYFKPVQPLNAFEQMDVTLSGIVIEVKPVQPENAYCLISLTLSFIITDLILSLGI